MCIRKADASKGRVLSIPMLRSALELSLREITKFSSRVSLFGRVLR